MSGCGGICSCTGKGGALVGRRRFVAAGAAALLLAGVGARVWWVNDRAPDKPEVVCHSMGTWVELDGAFNQSRGEDTAGYGVCVAGAEVLSYNEYVERYATDGSVPLEGLDARSLVCLDVDIRNEGDSSGGLALATMYLVPERRNEFFVSDAELLLMAETKLRESGSSGMGVSVRSGTEYATHLVYRRQGGEVDHGGIPMSASYFETIDDRGFELILSNLPVRHVVHIEV